jgi:cyclic pyranopterin phosphate synthase
MEDRNAFSHIDEDGSSKMVNVADKRESQRIAKAQAVVVLGEQLIEELKALEGRTKKGSVFDTARLAGIMGAKKTSELIPLCHPLFLDGVDIFIDYWRTDAIRIVATATTTGKTGVEMEALTAASVASLTIYDMCKAKSLTIEIRDVYLLEKKGGKRNYERTSEA